MEVDDLSGRCLAAAKRADEPLIEARWLARAFLTCRPVGDDTTKPRIAERLAQLGAGARSPELAFIHDAVRGLVDTEVGAVTGLRHLGLARSRFITFGLGRDPVLAALQARVFIAYGEPDLVGPLVAESWTEASNSAADQAALVASAARSAHSTGHVLRIEAALLEALQAYEQLPVGGSAERVALTCELAVMQALRGDIAGARHRLAVLAGGRRAARPAWHRGLTTTANAVVHWLCLEPGALIEALTPAVDDGLIGNARVATHARLELATAHVLQGHGHQARRVLAGAGFSSSAGPVGTALHAWSDWLHDADDVQRLDRLEHAATALTQPANTLLRGRLSWLVATTRADHGQGTAAVAALLRAREAFVLAGAGALVSLLAGDIAAMGVIPLQRRPDHVARADRRLGHPAAPELLTAEELRVAIASSDGLNAADAAYRLALPVKEVEEHLTEALEKLGVRNRSELRRLQRPPV